MLSLAAACAKDPFVEQEDTLPEGTPVTISLPFSAIAMPEVEVKTKSTLEEKNEYRISNLYVMLFDSDGNKFYGRMFDASNMLPSSSKVQKSSSECWCQTEGTGADATNGTVKISTVSKNSCTVWIGANVGLAGNIADNQTTLSKLEAVASLAQLQSIKMTLGENTLERRGYLPMSGIADRTVDDEYINTGSLQMGTVRVLLRRFDARVKFRIRFNTDNISDFQPLEWRVSRIPRVCYIEEQNTDAATQNSDFFDSKTVLFEGRETDKTSPNYTWNVFSFYMLENRLSPARTMDSGNPLEYRYWNREKQEKNPDPEDSESYVNGDWIYANANSTYVTFSADLKLTKLGLGKMLYGEDADFNEDEISDTGLTTRATYVVHLGNFTNSESESGSFNDYNTCRNHAYTYDIVVNNVREIYVEVTDEDREKEVQPSAIGGIIVAEQEIINCDAHYENHLMEFKYLDPQTIERYSWYVKTPFSTGYPKRMESGGHLVLSSDGEIQFEAEDLDYKWVMFLLNAEEEEGSPNYGEYKKTRASYPGDDSPVLMDINQLINCLYKNAVLEESGQDNIFRKNGLHTNPLRECVRVTAFVNEYYYEVNPITGEFDPSLWRRFVEAPARELHILADAKLSKDKESSVVTSSHSVVQRSIQTIYNTNSPTLTSLWGVENIDEFEEENWPYGSPSGSAISLTNGRLNSYNMWMVSPYEWDTHLNYEVEENVPQLRDGHQMKMYSCLARNRDNNGDGVIQEDELRWCTASIGQLNAMWIGDDALSLDARLYHQYDKKKYHVVSSTNTETVWAEEGGSNSGLAQSQQNMEAWYPEDHDKHYSVRCVRNVGSFDSETKDVTQADRFFETQPYVEIEKVGNGDEAFIKFDFKHLNPKALRFYSDAELVEADQHSVQNRVFRVFETQPLSNVVSFTPAILPEDMNQEITSTEKNNYCPPTYRLPNQRESELMALFYLSTFEEYFPSGTTLAPTRTYYNFGFYGKDKTDENGIGYDQKGGYKSYYEIESHHNSTNRGRLANKGNDKVDIVRCVRDVDASSSIATNLLVSNGSVYGHSAVCSPGSTVNISNTTDSPYSGLKSLIFYWQYYDRSTGDLVTQKVYEDPQAVGEKSYSKVMAVPVPGSAAGYQEIWQNLDFNRPLIAIVKAVNGKGAEAEASVSLTLKTLEAAFITPSAEAVTEESVDFEVSATSFTDMNLKTLKVQYSTDNGESWHDAGDSNISVGTFDPEFTSCSGKTYSGIIPLAFNTDGIYKLRLVAVDGDSSHSYLNAYSEEITVTAASETVVASISGSSTAKTDVPETYAVQAVSTTGNNLASVVVEYSADGIQWHTVGDSTVGAASLSPAFASSASYSGTIDLTFKTEGNVKLRVRAADSSSSPVERTSNVLDVVVTLPEIACSISADASSVQPDTYLPFSISATSNTEGNLQDFVFEYSADGGSSWTLSSASGSKMTVGTYTPSYTGGSVKTYSGKVNLKFSDAGTYQVRLTATDGTNEATAVSGGVIVSSETVTYYKKTGASTDVDHSFTLAEDESAFSFQLPTMNWTSGDYIEFQMYIPANSPAGIRLTIGEDPTLTGEQDRLNWYFSPQNIYVYPDKWTAYTSFYPGYNSTTGGIWEVTWKISSGGVQYHLHADSEGTWKYLGNETTAANAFNKISALGEQGALYAGIFGPLDQAAAKHNCTFNYFKVVTHGSAPAPTPVDITSVSIPATQSVEVGDDIQISASLDPSNASISTYTWTCTSGSGNVSLTDSDKATVTVHGVIAGTAELSLSVTDENGHTVNSGTCTVTVVPTSIKVSEITLNTSSATLSTASGPQHTQQIAATVLPNDADDKTIVWKSSNVGVATVNSGLVTAVGNGTVTITATANDGSGVHAECTVTVYTPLTNVSLPASKTVVKNSLSTLTAVLNPGTASIKTYNWTVSPNDNSIIALTDNGDGTATVTGVSTEHGTAIVTVSATDQFNTVRTSGNCVITVEEGSREEYLFNTDGTDEHAFKPDGANGFSVTKDVDFANGDYIEAEVNLKNATQNKDILSIGINISNWSWSIYDYFIRNDASAGKLTAYAVGDGGNSNTGGVSVAENIVIRITKDGLFYKDLPDGSFVQQGSSIDRFGTLQSYLNTNHTAIQIGSNRSGQYSDATYKYIKIVHGSN